MTVILYLAILIVPLMHVPDVGALEPAFSKITYSELVTRVGKVETHFTSMRAVEGKTLGQKRTSGVIKPPLTRAPRPLPPPLSSLIEGMGPGKSMSRPSRVPGGVPVFQGPSATATRTPSRPILPPLKYLFVANYPADPMNSMNCSLRPSVRAKALLCLDYSANRVKLAENASEPLPIASITKLITAMTVVDHMDLDKVLEVPRNFKKVERHVVGLRSGDLLTVRDLLHGLLIESGNDCAEVLARAYPKGGREGFLSAMNQLAGQLGATRTKLYTPSGLDLKPVGTGTTDTGPRLANTASAEDVALIARHAFTYPLIAEISSTKTHTMRTRNVKPRQYRLVSNDKLLFMGLPVVGAKTGYTDAAGRCIVALFKEDNKEHMVVLLNTPKHFSAAEKVYRWASSAF